MNRVHPGANRDKKEVIFRDGKIFEYVTSWDVDGIPTYTLREVK